MSELTPEFEPYSDITISDSDVLSEHKNLINQYKYTEATEKVNNDATLNKKGFRSSFFNAIENKIKDFQVYLLNKNASPEDYYSLTEPTAEEMENKKFWIRPIE